MIAAASALASGSFHAGLGGDKEQCQLKPAEPVMGAQHQQGEALERIAMGIETVAKLNSSFVKSEERDDVLYEFESCRNPDISLKDYLSRVVYYLNKWSGDESSGVRAIVTALIYIDRIYQLYPKSRVTFKNIHRIILVALLVSVKYMEDQKMSNSFWAKVGGVELFELNMLEIKLCKLLCFDLHVTRAEYVLCSKTCGLPIKNIDKTR